MSNEDKIQKFIHLFENKMTIEQKKKYINNPIVENITILDYYIGLLKEMRNQDEVNTIFNYIKELIKLKADVNSSVQTYLFMGGTSLDIINYLVEAKANVNFTRGGITPLTLSMERRADINIIKYLVEAKADVIRSDPLIQAINSRNIEYVNLLLKSKANINHYETVKDSTPLLYAMYIFQDDTKNNKDLTGIKNIIKLLIKSKAELDVINNKNSYTPLNFSIISGQTDVVKLIIDAKADVNFGKYTPLLFMSLYTKKDQPTELNETGNIIFKLLIEAQADPYKISVGESKILYSLSKNKNDKKDLSEVQIAVYNAVSLKSKILPKLLRSNRMFIKQYDQEEFLSQTQEKNEQQNKQEQNNNKKQLIQQQDASMIVPQNSDKSLEEKADFNMNSRQLIKITKSSKGKLIITRFNNVNELNSSERNSVLPFIKQKNIDDLFKGEDSAIYVFDDDSEYTDWLKSTYQIIEQEDEQPTIQYMQQPATFFASTIVSQSTNTTSQEFDQKVIEPEKSSFNVILSSISAQPAAFLASTIVSQTTNKSQTFKDIIISENKKKYLNYVKNVKNVNSNVKIYNFLNTIQIDNSEPEIVVKLYTNYKDKNLDNIYISYYFPYYLLITFILCLMDGSITNDDYILGSIYENKNGNEYDIQIGITGGGHNNEKNISAMIREITEESGLSSEPKNIRHIFSEGTNYGFVSHIKNFYPEFRSENKYANKPAFKVGCLIYGSKQDIQEKIKLVKDIDAENDIIGIGAVSVQSILQHIKNNYFFNFNEFLNILKNKK